MADAGKTLVEPLVPGVKAGQARAAHGNGSERFHLLWRQDVSYSQTAFLAGGNVVLTLTSP